MAAILAVVQATTRAMANDFTALRATSQRTNVAAVVVAAGSHAEAHLA